VKIASDNSDIDVMVTRGVDGRPPDIWLRWLSVEANPMIVRITIEEARAIAAPRVNRPIMTAPGFRELHPR
jgi:hypothetical protein